MHHDVGIGDQPADVPAVTDVAAELLDGTLELGVVERGDVERPDAVAVGEEPSPDFVPVEAWGALARALAHFNQKGSKIGVTGRIRSEFWAPEGEKGSLRTAVVAVRIDFLTPKPKAAAEETEAVAEAPATRPVATSAKERPS